MTPGVFRSMLLLAAAGGLVGLAAFWVLVVLPVVATDQAPADIDNGLRGVHITHFTLYL